MNFAKFFFCHIWCCSCYYCRWVGTLLFVASMALYVVMCVSDPGVIRSDNIQELKQYVNHPVMYPEMKYCRTCKTLKWVRLNWWHLVIYGLDCNGLMSYCVFGSDCHGRSIVACAIIVLADSTTSRCLDSLPRSSIMAIMAIVDTCCANLAMFCIVQLQWVSRNEDRLVIFAVVMLSWSLMLWFLFAALNTVWFNGCVGEKNYKYFLVYLVVGRCRLSAHEQRSQHQQSILLRYYVNNVSRPSLQSVLKVFSSPAAFFLSRYVQSGDGMMPLNLDTCFGWTHAD